ncbi:MAG: AAA family ATPase [Planctomycetota bacterium]|jgi:SpoVK/Ycf46/Vps4 family AAA+-type ATPase
MPSELRRLIVAQQPCIRLITSEEPYARKLIDEVALEHLDPYWIWTAVQGLIPGLVGQPETETGTENAAAALVHLAMNTTGPAIAVFCDLAAHLDDAPTRRALREAIEACRTAGATLILIDHDDVAPGVIKGDSVQHELALPDETELEAIVKESLRHEHRKANIEVRLKRRELEAIVRNLAGLTRTQARQVVLDLVTDDRRLDAEDLNHLLAAKRRHMSGDGVLEFIEAPVSMAEIGGLRHLKHWLGKREKALSDEAREYGLNPPRGMLLLGVQGAGKSLCAKAVATAWHRPLLRLDPGALYDRYIGESEQRLRAALRQAERMAPIVLWVDEIEKGFASAASRSADGGLSQRMFGTLLTWMQEHDAPVFLVATANDIEALPPELLRKGRFDEIFFVDLPGKAARRQILTIHLRSRKQDPRSFDLDVLVNASDGYSGAEIEQAIVSSMHEAFSSGDDLDTATVLETLKGSPPLSVTMAERIAKLRRWADGRCVPAGSFTPRR